jgi:hypothetical protein
MQIDRLTCGYPGYPYPNDEQELDRLDMQHHMFKLINNGRLFLAPLKGPKRILDIGTGTGIWPIEMGMHSLKTRFRCYPFFFFSMHLC